MHVHGLTVVGCLEAINRDPEDHSTSNSRFSVGKCMWSGWVGGWLAGCSFERKEGEGGGKKELVLG